REVAEHRSGEAGHLEGVVEREETFDRRLEAGHTRHGDRSPIPVDLVDVVVVSRRVFGLSLGSFQVTDAAETFVAAPVVFADLPLHLGGRLFSGWASEVHGQAFPAVIGLPKM